MTWWPRVAIFIGLLIGLVGCIVLVALLGRELDVRTGLVLLSTFAAIGASIAAALHLIGTLIERIRKRPLAIATDRAVLLPPIVAGVAQLMGALVVTSLAVTPEYLGLAIAGVGLAVATMWLSRGPVSARTAIVLAVLTIAIVEIPRELGWADARLSRTSRKQSSRVDHTGDCALNRGVAIVSRLTGNVGEHVASDDPEEARVLATFEGTADAGWVACMLPLIKPLSLHATLRFDIRGPGCTGSGSLDIDLSATTFGIHSCRTARNDLARALRVQMERALH